MHGCQPPAEELRCGAAINAVQEPPAAQLVPCGAMQMCDVLCATHRRRRHVVTLLCVAVQLEKSDVVEPATALHGIGSGALHRAPVAFAVPTCTLKARPSPTLVMQRCWVLLQTEILCAGCKRQLRACLHACAGQDTCSRPGRRAKMKGGAVERRRQHIPARLPAHAWRNVPARLPALARLLARLPARLHAGQFVCWHAHIRLPARAVRHAHTRLLAGALRRAHTRLLAEAIWHHAQEQWKRPEALVVPEAADVRKVLRSQQWRRRRRPTLELKAPVWRHLSARALVGQLR
mmetsp:Transcript_33231/g.98977  ORF Transcript_33231/g.98977 Transcript_33231/m.98977 type:complete len:291 (-) Transcript_33231:541-1413(-)